MKYLFKYMCKGNDRVDVQTNALNNHMPFANQGFTPEELEQINQIEQQHAEQRNQQHQPLENDNEEFVHNDDYSVQLNRDITNDNNVDYNTENDHNNNGTELPNGEPNVELIEQIQAEEAPIIEAYDEIRTYESKIHLITVLCLFIIFFV